MEACLLVGLQGSLPSKVRPMGLFGQWVLDDPTQPLQPFMIYHTSRHAVPLAWNGPSLFLSPALLQVSAQMPHLPPPYRVELGCPLDSQRMAVEFHCVVQACLRDTELPQDTSLSLMDIICLCIYPTCRPPRAQKYLCHAVNAEWF